MNEQAEVLKRRTKRFALNILALARQLPRTDECRHIGGQLIASATAVGANYRSTCRSRTDGDFIARIGVALEEADESAFWLEILAEGELFRSEDAVKLLDEADQLSAIFARSRLTAVENAKRRKAETHRASRGACKNLKSKI